MDAPVYKKLVDIEEHTENPFFTKEGQLVVSESENFWQRALRYGRTAFKYVGNSTLNAGITQISLTFQPSAGTIFIPDCVSVSANVDATVFISYQVGDSNFKGFDSTMTDEYLAVAFCKAGTPLTIKLDGSLQIVAGGQIQCRIQGVTNGQGFASVHGVEVTKHA